VMIEARKVGDISKWHLVAFRSHFDALEMSYKGTRVWNAPSVPELAFSGPLQMPFQRNRTLPLHHQSHCRQRRRSNDCSNDFTVSPAVATILARSGFLSASFNAG